MSSADASSFRGQLYGQLAFGCLVLAAFFDFVFRRNIEGEPWQVIVTFVCGGAFGLIGVFSHHVLGDETPRRTNIYFMLQVVLASITLYVSPIRGFFGILPLPLVSQAIFMFRWGPALAFAVSIYLVACGVFLSQYGVASFVRALVTFAPGYVFTTAFSFIAADAIRARERSVQLLRDVESAHALLRAQATQAEELATTRERNRLAREIHDGVGHYLTVINVQLQAARSLWAQEPARAEVALSTAEQLSREALDEIRKSVTNLRDENPTVNLPARFEDLCLQPDLRVEYRVDGEPRPLAASIEHALFRAAQEALTNVRKHAGCAHARLQLDFRAPQRVILRVTDHGRGASNSPRPGFGLRGMRERVELLRGRVATRAVTPHGFELEVELPT
ncbi:MAG TPA: sensor histidine kinase [Candidatus Synoicihabitans sp.]|nr:sensor histidine kinase [Candidatus Synoicihabitans sp.]